MPPPFLFTPAEPLSFYSYPQSNMAEKKTVENRPVDEVYIKLETIMPDRAQHLLDISENIRRTSPRQVRQWSYSLLNDKWTPENATVIRINKQGKLVDGFNRMTAVVATGKPMPVFVAYNAVADNVDVGMSRKASDYLASLGYINSFPLSAMSRFLRLYERSELGQRESKVGNWEHKEVLERYPEAPEFLAVARAVLRSTHLPPPSSIAAVACVGAKGVLDTPCVSRWFEGLGTGANLANQSPLLVLRDLWGSYRQKRNAIQQNTGWAWVILAWNLHAQGRDATRDKIHWKSGNPKWPFPDVFVLE